MFGFYPAAEYWRVILAGILMLLALAYVLFEHLPYRIWGLLYAALYPIIAFFLLAGGLGLEPVETDRWGGLMLTIVIGVTGIVASLPIGIVLALGRRSQMPIVRILCVAFIEFIRGVPLITVLFMASVMLPLFLPEGVNFNKLLRALIGVALFSSAYMAEVIRGGLQAIPKGQYEAAQALGLSYWKMMGLIVLPQALKIVIPGIVNTFIGLFKDSTLVLIIGLFDLLGIVKAAITDANWIGLSHEAYAFAGATFWIFCFSMSRYSIWLENKLHTGHKR
jgi:general L-amino acid transport system permease protein